MRWARRYLLRRASVAVGWALITFTLLVAALQLMRLGHHLLAGTAALADGVWLLALALPTIVIAVAPAAVLVGLLLTGFRLRVEGAWEALAAAGAHPAQRAWPLLAVALGVALLVAALGTWAEPRALAFGAPRLWRQAARAWLYQFTPGRWYQPAGAAGAGGGLSLRATAVVARGRDALTLRGVLLARSDPPALAVAQQARLGLDAAGGLALALRAGEALLPRTAAGAWRVRYATGQRRLDLQRDSARHLAWLQRRRASGAGAAPRAGLCLLFGLCATLLSLGAHHGGWVVTIALAVLATAELGGWIAALLLLGATEALARGLRRRARRRGPGRSAQDMLISPPSTCS